jgi:hypothetical protein
MVVKSLRDGEEPRVAFDDQPTGVDADASHVRQQDLEHLRDTSSGPIEGCGVEHREVGRPVRREPVVRPVVDGELIMRRLSTPAPLRESA